MRKFLVTIFLFLIASQAFAIELICSKPNMAMLARTFSSTDVAKSWFPPFIRLDDDTVRFGSSRSRWNRKYSNYSSTAGRWQIHTKSTSKEDFMYKMSYQKPSNTLQVTWKPQGGYKNGLTIYATCEKISGQRTSDGGTANRARSKFNSLSSCNRKYIQNFLKTAGLYNSSIDGQWGPGTAKAIRGASNLSKLRGLSSEEIIRKLSNNLICD